MRSPLPILLLFLCAAGCAYQTVKSGPVRIGDLSLTTPAAWAQIDPNFLRIKGPTAIWTRDGLPLNQVLLYAGIEDGSPLFVERNNDRPFGTFRSDMLEVDVHELLVDSIGRYAEAAQVTTLRLSPLLFAGTGGFQSEFAFSSKATDLDYRGLSAGAVIDGKLYLLVYIAPRIHYFEAEAATFQQIVGSARLAEAST